MNAELKKYISDVFRGEVSRQDKNSNTTKEKSSLLDAKTNRITSKFILDKKYKLQLDEII